MSGRTPTNEQGQLAVEGAFAALREAVTAYERDPGPDSARRLADAYEAFRLASDAENDATG